MARHSPLLLCLASVIAAGCGASSAPPPAPPDDNGQSYSAAIRLYCDADRLAGIESEDDPLEKSQKRDDFLADHIKNPDAIYFRTMIRVRSEAEQAQALREEAKTCGGSACRLADVLEREHL